MISQKTLFKVLKSRYLTEDYWQDQDIEDVAMLLIQDDFKKNRITTWGEVFKFLDYVQSIRVTI